jgi:serine/threonine protein kinase
MHSSDHVSGCETPLACFMFHSRALSSVHWSGIRARRLSSHHGEFCKLFCSHTSREVDFFSNDSARSGEQLLNMIGMCTAFSIGNQFLSAAIQKRPPSNVFECTLHSTPPATFSVVASAHDPTVPAAEFTSQFQPIKLWTVSLSGTGSLSIDERRLPADTHVTFADTGNGLPVNIHAGCRYLPACIQSSSFQLLRPDFLSLFDVECSSAKALQAALSSVRQGAVGQPVSKELRDLINVDPANRKAFKTAIDAVKRSASDAGVSKDMAVLFSVACDDHEALKSALDDVKQGLLGVQGTDPKHPGMVDFRNMLCHNLLTLDVRHFDALVACTRNIFAGICSICPFIGDVQESEHARQSLDEIESIVKRDIQVATLTEQERETLVRQREQMLEERDRLKVKLDRKFDSFAPCLKRDISDQLVAGMFTRLYAAVHCRHALLGVCLSLVMRVTGNQIGKSGGQGTVYRVRYSLWGQTLAVKIFHESAEGHAWRRELNSLTFLTHANIVRMFYIVYETLEDRSECHAPVGYAMEAMHRSAADRYEYSLEQLLNIFEQIASALAFSHQLGVIHFDVKPENILLDAACSLAKLCDFGCAHKLRSVAANATASMVGHLRGTLDYMAPEAYHGDLESSPHLCDVYSFGKTMWKLLHLSRVVDPLSECKVTAEVPAVLKELVEQCTLKDAAKRPQDMSGVLERLQSVSAVPNEPPVFGSDEVIRAALVYLRENGHTSADSAILLSLLGLQPHVQIAMASANNAKLSRIVLSRPDLFGVPDQRVKSKMAVYSVLSARDAPSHSVPSPTAAAPKQVSDGRGNFFCLLVLAR